MLGGHSANKTDPETLALFATPIVAAAVCAKLAVSTASAALYPPLLSSPTLTSCNPVRGRLRGAAHLLHLPGGGGHQLPHQVRSPSPLPRRFPVPAPYPFCPLFPAPAGPTSCLAPPPRPSLLRRFRRCLTPGSHLRCAFSSHACAFALRLSTPHAPFFIPHKNPAASP